MSFKLKEDQNLGVIVRKLASGLYETNKKHRHTSGNIGDTLMLDVNRKVYVIPKENDEKSEDDVKNEKLEDETKKNDSSKGNVTSGDTK